MAKTRADADRNRQAILDAAASCFAADGVDVPARTVAGAAGVGVGTLYRHFPDRTALVIAVYRHQVDACAEAGPRYLAEESSPIVALARWIDDFVDFLVTKHGLAGALGDAGQNASSLHTFFLERLLPVCEELLAAGVAAGEVRRADIGAYDLLRSIGNICIGGEQGTEFDPRRMAGVLVSGLTVAGSYRAES